jgi:hypothetical protein
MRLYALVEAGDPKAVDVYLSEHDAQRASRTVYGMSQTGAVCFVSRRSSSTTNTPRSTSYLDSDSELCRRADKNSGGTPTPNTLISRSGRRRPPGVEMGRACGCGT